MRLGELSVREYPEQDSALRWGATLKYANGCETACWSSTPTLALEALSRAIIDNSVPEYVAAWEAWMESSRRNWGLHGSPSDAFVEWCRTAQVHQ